MKKLIPLILKSQNIVLSTHRQCDGDGLGAELALFHALSKLNKNVKVINVDATPRKYVFLEPHKYVQVFETQTQVPEKIDLLLVFDTNDHRLLEPLYSELQGKNPITAFIDHHPILKSGPQPTENSWIDVKAASTGEMVFQLIEALQIPWDGLMAQAIYTSIVFDTQLFRYIRNSPKSHAIAAQLLEYPFDINEIHRFLFSQQTPDKIAFLCKALLSIEYTCEERLAFIKIKKKDLIDHKMGVDDSRDLIDFVMSIDRLDAAVVFREDAPNEYKLSLRSKGRFDVLQVAEKVGGGGHVSASGAYLKGNYEDLKNLIVSEMTQLLKKAA